MSNDEPVYLLAATLRGRARSAGHVARFWTACVPKQQQRHRLTHGLEGEGLVDKRFVLPQGPPLLKEPVAVAGAKEHLHVGIGVTQTPRQLSATHLGHRHVNDISVE